MDKNQMLEYIKISRAQGLTEEVIWDTLKLNGSSDADIEAAFHLSATQAIIANAHSKPVIVAPTKTVEEKKPISYLTLTLLFLAGALIIIVLVTHGFK